MSRFLLAALLLGLQLIAVKGQTCAEWLEGTVIDEHEAEPLQAASVYLIKQQKGAYTNSKGHFRLENLCPGTDTMIVSHLGCETQYVPVQVGQSPMGWVITMEHHSEYLSAVEVHGHMDHVISTDPGLSLQGEQLDRMLGADISEMSSRLPGVRMLSTGAQISKPIIDGLGGSRLQIIQNGIALATQDWGDEHALEIDPFGASSLRVLRGGAALGYGVSTSGAALIVEAPSLPETKGIDGQALLSFASNARQGSAGVHLGQRFNDRWALSSQFFALNAADARAPDYVLSNTGNRRSGASLGILYRKALWDWEAQVRVFHQESGILRAAHIGNLSDLQRALQADTPLIIRPYTRDINPPRQVATHHWISSGLSRKLDGESSLRLDYSLQYNSRQEYDIRRAGRSAIPTIDLGLLTQDLMLGYEKAMSGNGQLRAGLHGQMALNRNDAGTGVEPFIPFYNQQSLGIWADRNGLTGSWAWELGGRLDWRHTLGKWFVSDEVEGRTLAELQRYEWLGSASAGLVWYRNDESLWRSRLSYASRTPNAAERFADGVHHALAVIQKGDTTLRVEHGLKWQNSYSYTPSELFEIHFGGFVHAFNGYIYQQALAEPSLTVRGAFPVFEFRQGDALLAGLDLDIHGRGAAWNWGLEANYLYGSLLEDGSALPDIAPLRVRAELGYGRTLSGRIKDWRLALWSVGQSRAWMAPEILPAAPPPGFVLMGLDLSSHIALGQKSLGFHFTVNNLLNARYREYLDRLRFYADRPGRDFQLRLIYDF